MPGCASTSSRMGLDRVLAAVLGAARPARPRRCRRSSASPGRRRSTSNGLRSITSNVTRCRWIGCVSAVVLTSSQSSVAPALGLVVTTGRPSVRYGASSTFRVIGAPVSSSSVSERCCTRVTDGSGSRSRGPAARGRRARASRRCPAAAGRTRIFISWDSDGPPAHRKRRAGVVGDDERAAAAAGEVDDDVGALARSDQQGVQLDRRAQQPAVGADLRERQRPAAVLACEAQVVQPRLGAVDDPEPVAPRLDVHVRPDLGVDDRDVAEELRHPLRVVGPSRPTVG